MVEAMGGKCQICGYDRCPEALDFHHLNPDEKDFGFGKIIASPKAVSKIIIELKKCVMLCSNCHREVHAGIIEITENPSPIKEECLLAEVNLKKKIKQQNGYSNAYKSSRTISSNKDRRKIFLDTEQMIELLNTEFKGNKSALARHLNVSETAVRKKLKEIDNVP